MKEILQCLLFGVQHKEKYPPKVREFCLNLHYLSVRAYSLIRSTFDDNLPHPVTLRRWYANSDMCCEPGIHESSLNILRNKANEKKKQAKELLVSVCFDEMFIRKHFQWCNEFKRMLGFPTFPSPDTNTEREFMESDLSLEEAANQAFVFMVVGLNENIKLPVAYHFISSLGADMRSILVQQVIAAVRSTGAVVVDISFDGLLENKKNVQNFWSQFGRIQ